MEDINLGTLVVVVHFDPIRYTYDEHTSHMKKNDKKVSKKEKVYQSVAKISKEKKLLEKYS